MRSSVLLLPAASTARAHQGTLVVTVPTPPGTGGEGLHDGLHGLEGPRRPGAFPRRVPV
jgi:hypothetical protein